MSARDQQARDAEIRIAALEEAAAFCDQEANLEAICNRHERAAAYQDAARGLRALKTKDPQ